jgi:hypothetical protein
VASGQQLAGSEFVTPENCLQAVCQAAFLAKGVMAERKDFHEIPSPDFHKKPDAYLQRHSVGGVTP